MDWNNILSSYKEVYKSTPMVVQKNGEIKSIFNSNIQYETFIAITDLVSAGILKKLSGNKYEINFDQIASEDNFLYTLIFIYGEIEDDPEGYDGPTPRISYNGAELLQNLITLVDVQSKIVAGRGATP